MTAQIPDTFEDEGGESIVFDQTGRPFSPESVGLTPVWASTALYRGFRCHFGLRDQRLILSQLWIGLSGREEALAQSGQGPLIDGRAPTPERYAGFRYDGLALPCPFSGALLIVRGRSAEGLGSRGPVGSPRWSLLAYDFVAEYSFADGVLGDRNDLSSVARDLHRLAVGEGSLDDANRRFREHTRFFNKA